MTVSAALFDTWIQINSKRFAYVQCENSRRKYMITVTDLWQTSSAIFQEDWTIYEFLFLVDYDYMFLFCFFIFSIFCIKNVK